MKRRNTVITTLLAGSVALFTLNGLAIAAPETHSGSRPSSAMNGMTGNMSGGRMSAMSGAMMGNKSGGMMSGMSGAMMGNKSGGMMARMMGGMSGGRGMMQYGSAGLHHMLSRLDLSDAQRDKVFTLVYKQIPALRAKKIALRKGRQALHKATQSKNYDAQRIRTLADAQARTQSTLIVMHAELIHRVTAILTPKQRGQLQQMQAMRSARPAMPAS